MWFYWALFIIKIIHFDGNKFIILINHMRKLSFQMLTNKALCLNISGEHHFDIHLQHLRILNSNPET